eukprot:COSAG04_NODE_1685_length_5956_cov_7.393034_6_plen_129_part_00
MRAGVFWVWVLFGFVCRTGLVLIVDTEDIHPVFAARPERRRPNLSPASTPENIRVKTQPSEKGRVQAFGRSRGLPECLGWGVLGAVAVAACGLLAPAAAAGLAARHTATPAVVLLLRDSTPSAVVSGL